MDLQTSLRQHQLRQQLTNPAVYGTQKIFGGDPLVQSGGQWVWYQASDPDVHGDEMFLSSISAQDNKLNILKSDLIDGVWGEPELALACPESLSAVETPSYIKVGAVERLYFTQWANNGPTYDYKIGYAEKVAGSWEYQGACLTPTDPWELHPQGTIAGDQTVCHDGENWHIYYQLGHLIEGVPTTSFCYATSVDGVTWTDRQVFAFDPPISDGPYHAHVIHEPFRVTGYRTGAEGYPAGLYVYYDGNWKLLVPDVDPWEGKGSCLVGNKFYYHQSNGAVANIWSSEFFGLPAPYRV